jgi:glycosyltransferase involved in cell wall biosynthesis
VTAAERALGRSRLAVPQGHVVLLVAPCADVPASQLLSLHALAAVPRELREQTVMVVLAPPAYDPLLREAAAQLDVRENVRFVGDDAEFQQLLPAADVLIVTPFSEDMPLAPIQAMFARIAIVSTPWAGAETMLGNGLYGFITGGFEPSDVASEVIRALRNDGARNAMIHRAHERARAEYDIDRVADAHRSLYRQMCAAITCAR